MVKMRFHFIRVKLVVDGGWEFPLKKEGLKKIYKLIMLRARIVIMK